MKRTLSPEAIAAGYSVEKVKNGEAYPRNGNVDAPTPRYTWTAKLNERVIGMLLPKQLDALQIVADHMADPR